MFANLHADALHPDENNHLPTNEFVDFFSNIDSFRADFTQDIEGEITRGVVSFARPKSIKWHTFSPDEKVLMLADNKITSYDVWLQVANIIDYQYNKLVEYLTTKPRNLTQLPTFVATQDLINYYELDSIYFGFKDKILVKIITTNNADKNIHITLENMQQNIDLQDNFSISFPRDVDILDETR
jgi:outer membrane lipoprotein-sorting protein